MERTSIDTLTTNDKENKNNIADDGRKNEW